MCTFPSFSHTLGEVYLITQKLSNVFLSSFWTHNFVGRGLLASPAQEGKLWFTALPGSRKGEVRAVEVKTELTDFMKKHIHIFYLYM